jgi:uncharacterized protein YcaQ
VLTPVTLSPKQAIKIALSSQGLNKPNAFGQGINGVLAAIQQLSYVQIDSISVIQRAHHHCLWSRVNDYQPNHLEKLIAQKQVFEYWSHAAAYLPMQDYRFSLPKKQAIAAGEKHWREKNPVAEKRVLNRVREEGPLRAKDFETDPSKKSTGWWDWKPDKIALEQLFIEGELMIVQRQGFQKVYDLAERVLPTGLNTTKPSNTEFERYLVTRYLKAHGLGTVQQISYLRKGIKNSIAQTCQQMLENHDLQQVQIGEQCYYALPNAIDLLKQTMNRNQVNILSPFDNLVIQRKRLSELFGFDYQIECYVPPAKRQYGYFSLPLLWADKFVGRMDAKIDRKTQILHIQNLHLDTFKAQEFVQTLKPKLQAFKQFNGGTTIEVHQVNSDQPLSSNQKTEIKQCLVGI